MNPNGAAPEHKNNGPKSRHLDDASSSMASSSGQAYVDPLTSSTFANTPDSNDAIKMEFCKRFGPAVSQSRDFVLSPSAFAPTAPSISAAISDLLKDPSNRSCAWRFIGTMGIDDVFSESERRALCAGLLSYVEQDREESVIPLIEMALCAADQRDMGLYKAIGEVVRAAGLGSEIADATVSGFCALRSYNAIHESEFHPWMEIFARSNSLPIYQSIANTLADRVMAQLPGTYDHLLRTLCMAESSIAASVLQALVAAPLPPDTATIPKPNSWKIALGALTPICLGSAVTAGIVEAAFALGQSGDVLAAFTTGLLTPRVWVVSGVLGALAALAQVSTAWAARDQLVHFCDAIRTHLLSADYHHLAERIYARLGETAPHNRYAPLIRHAMESCDAYATVMDGWRRNYPLATISIKSETTPTNLSK